MVKVSTTGMAVSLKADLRFPITGQQGHRHQIIHTRFLEMPRFVIEKLPVTGRLVSLNPNQITRRFERALPKLGIKNFRFHDLRHYAASIMHAIGVPDQYIMQRGGWNSDKTLKAIYRGTIEEYTQKYTDMTLSHFDSMQHEMQHEKEKA